MVANGGKSSLPGRLFIQGREASKQGDKMSRNQILVAGVILWSAFAIDVVAHLSWGDWAAPMVAMVVGILATAMVAMRRVRRVRRSLSQAS
jgi:hypothetical protein